MFCSPHSFVIYLLIYYKRFSLTFPLANVQANFEVLEFLWVRISQVMPKNESTLQCQWLPKTMFSFCLHWLGGWGESQTQFHLVTQESEQGTIMPGERGSASLLQPGSKACHFCSHPIGENESHGPPYMRGNQGMRASRKTFDEQSVLPQQSTLVVTKNILVLFSTHKEHSTHLQRFL